jgi:HEAT repeat protein
VKKLVSIVALFGATQALSLLEAQPPQGNEPNAKSAIKAIGDKLFRVGNDEKAALQALKEYDEAARELRDTSHWMPSLLKPHRKSTVKIELLKTMAVIRDPSYVHLATQVLDDPDDQTRGYAANTLWQLEPSRDPIPKLVKLTKDKSPFVRGCSVRALGRYAIYFREAMPPVIAALDDNEPIANGNPHSARSFALVGLRFCGADAKEAVPRIVQVMKTAADHHNETLAAQALVQIDPTEPTIVETAKKWMKSETHRSEGVGLLWALGSHAKPAIPDLILILQKTDVRDKTVEAQIKIGVVRVFERLGPLAKEALPHLIKLAMDTEDKSLREEIDMAIKSIRSDN